MRHSPWVQYAIMITIIFHNNCSISLASAFAIHNRIKNTHAYKGKCDSYKPLNFPTFLHSKVHEEEQLDMNKQALMALENSGLTRSQAANVLERQTAQTTSNINSNKIAEVLDWLTANGRFSPKQAAEIVLGHPTILSYDIRTNLAPTIQFYQDALNLTLSMEMNVNHPDSTFTVGNETPSTQIDPRVADLLCESPGLLEYNVKKRLKPRLEEMCFELKLTEEVNVNEEDLRAIATKTDSRFKEWLLTKNNSNGTTQHIPDHNADNNGIKRSPSSYVVVSNLQSGGNIGNILRSASIFGCEECVVVGQKRHRLTGDHGSRFDLRRRHIWSHTDAREYLHQRGIRIYGIEIMANASPIMKYDPETGVVDFPFDRRWEGAAFVMGNEGNGLSDKQREICDEFLFIPQTRGGRSDGGGGGSSSLNVACAATVILQAYCLWANYPCADVEGEKFIAISSENEQLRYRE